MKWTSLVMTVVAILALLLGVQALTFVDQKRPKVDDVQAELVALQVPPKIDSYFVFATGDQSQPLQGFQFYDSTDKLGITKSALDAYPNRTSDFLQFGKSRWPGHYHRSAP